MSVPTPNLTEDRSEILRAGRLGGVDPEVLAERFGTPLYVYDLDVIDRQVGALQAVLPPNAELAYAVKANPALAVVTYLGALGLGADVASGGELATALRARIPADRIVMTGPGKRDAELRAAVEAGGTGIRAVTVESLGELARLEAIARDVGRCHPVMLRAAVSSATSQERVRLVGDDGAGKFGMDGADLVEGARIAARSPHLDLLGLHAFGASNVLDARALVVHVQRTGSTARELAREANTTVRIVDAGGGLGIPYGPDESPLDLVALGHGLADVAASWASDHLLAEARLVLEPGRYLVGPSGAYLARVVDVKSVNGATVAVLDGGVHHVLRPALVRQEHRVRLLASDDAGARGDHAVPVTVAGPLCSGLDILAVAASMIEPRVGDLMAVLDVGAYGFTESMPYFLSHPIPAEVLVREGDAALIRPRLDPGEWLHRQLVPDLAADAVSSGLVRP